MFAHDLCHSQIACLRNSIDFYRKDRATHGESACAARATSTNRQYSIVNIHFFLVCLYRLDDIGRRIIGDDAVSICGRVNAVGLV